MKIPLISQLEFEDKYFLITEHGIFTPLYTYEEYFERGGLYYYRGLVITMTADKVYDDYLYNKDNPPKPQPTVEEKVNGLIPIVQYQGEDLEFQGEIALDLDYRLTMIEMSLNINIRTIRGDDEMAAKPNSTTYRNAKKQIERGNYEYETMLTMLDTFLLGNRITQAEYDELKERMDSQQ